jgi:hypothetical protein
MRAAATIKYVVGDRRWFMLNPVNFEQKNYSSGCAPTVLLAIDAAHAFDQPHELVPHGLILDSRQRAAHPNVDRIGH